MRVAIAYCLGFPKRLSLSVPRVDLITLGALTFEAPRDADFPCLGLARQALAAGASHTVVLNAANEVAVARFLQGGLSFRGIAAAIAAALDAHSGETCLTRKPSWTATPVFGPDRVLDRRASELTLPRRQGGLYCAVGRTGPGGCPARRRGQTGRGGLRRPTALEYA
jgi:hypothetical protein